ncbi:transposase [Ensifer sp. R-19]|uniref:transposase n=1 Tax=Ensifer sp. R-19 TaxID=3404055 RepID=UPI003CF4C676
MSAPSSGTRNFHMIEAVPERLEGAPRQFRRRWSDEFKERAVAEAMEPGTSVSAIAQEYIRRNYLAGAAMLVPDNDPSRRIRLFRWERPPHRSPSNSGLLLSCRAANRSKPRRNASGSMIEPSMPWTGTSAF